MESHLGFSPIILGKEPACSYGVRTPSLRKRARRKIDYFALQITKIWTSIFPKSVTTKSTIYSVV